MKCLATLCLAYSTLVCIVQASEVVNNLASISVFTSLEVSAHIKHPNYAGAFYSIGEHILLSGTSLACVGWNLAQALPNISLRISECTARIKLYSMGSGKQPDQ